MIKKYSKLPDIHFIAGSYQKFSFELYDDAGDAFDISDTEISVAVGNLKKETIINKTLAIVPGSPVTNVAVLELTSQDTEYLEGIYPCQLNIKKANGELVIPAEFNILVAKKIKGGDTDNGIQN